MQPSLLGLAMGKQEKLLEKGVTGISNKWGSIVGPVVQANGMLRLNQIEKTSSRFDLDIKNDFKLNSPATNIYRSVVAIVEFHSEAGEIQYVFVPQ